MADYAKTSFAEMLVGDVLASMQRRSERDDQSSRRDLVRTSFAAIEGLAWVFREHVIEVAQSTYGLDEPEVRALSEVSYHVNDKGKISQQPKFIPLVSQIRLIARIAERISSNACIDFSGSDWDRLRNAVGIRNRITHPKTAADLELSGADADTCLAALFWFFTQASDAMERGNLAAKDYLGRFEDVLRKLRSGDPEVTALYNYLVQQDEGI